MANAFTQKGRLKEVRGSFTNPINSNLKILVNFCSQNGNFENTLDKELTKKWSRVRTDYKTCYAVQANCKMGGLIESVVGSDVWVVNMIVRDKNDKLDAKGLELAVKNLVKMALYEKASLHIDKSLLDNTPNFNDLLVSKVQAEGVHIYVYDNAKAAPVEQ